MSDWDALMNCAKGDPGHVAEWQQIVRDGQAQEARWVASLREQGFKAAHPNDGWVDRERQELTLCYPQFDDGVKVGDHVMLGWPTDPPARWRPVLITSIRKSPLGVLCYSFEDYR